MSKEIILFTKPMCGGCELLKHHIQSKGIAYREMDGMSAKGRAELLCAGYSSGYLPALLVNGRLYEYAALFSERGELLELGDILA